MQTNLQSTTFNTRNRIKREYVNQRHDPRVNRISDDLKYKRRSITNVERNPVHINGGSEYLYNRRIEEIKRKLNTHVINVDQYNAELQRIQIAMFGRPVNNQDVIVTPKLTKRANTQMLDNVQPEQSNEEESGDESESVSEKQPEDDRSIIDIINDPENKQNQ